MTKKKLGICLLLCLCLCLCGCAGGSDEPRATEQPRFANAPDLDIAAADISLVLEAGETALLSQLPQLRSADLSGSECLEEIFLWAGANPQVDVKYSVTLPDGTVLDTDTKSVDLSDASGADAVKAAEQLRYLPSLRSIELGRERPGMDFDSIAAVQELCPDAKVRYVFDLYGKETDIQNTMINLSHIPVDDGGQAIMEAMACMPDLSYLDMDSCGLSDEEMAAIRDAFPHVKVVWRVWLGNNRTYSVRTDVERILASKSSIAGSLDPWNASGLKYCTDVKYLDLGHNYALSDISFVAHMPKLEVAILAMGCWYDASPLANCTELEYLEMQTTQCTDLSPLSGLTKLRHLNVAGIGALTDISPLYSLTELERLYIGSKNGVSWEQVEEMQRCAPNCEINASVYDDPTSEGWRYSSDGTWNFRYFILRKQFDGYTDEAFSYWWNDPLY